MAALIDLLPVGASGVEAEATPFIRLEDGTLFSGYRPDQSRLKLYTALSRRTQRRISKECMGLAVDLILRYQYPHADVTCTPPVPRPYRKCFHAQHRDTISDLPVTEGRKGELRRRFAFNDGDVVIDVGAYIGLGAMALSRRVGQTGRVISLEAHPAHQSMWRRNLSVNGIGNATLIDAACTDGRGDIELRCDSLQANSVVDIKEVQGVSTITVPTISLDEVVREERLAKVDMVSVTINGAEVEALEGMERILHDFGPKLSVAGWYQRAGRRVADVVSPRLEQRGYEVVVGPAGRVYAWKL